MVINYSLLQATEAPICHSALGMQEAFCLVATCIQDVTEGFPDFIHPSGDYLFLLL